MQAVKINEYQIVENIGYGSGGYVYLVKSVKGQTYALKKIQVSNNDSKLIRNQVNMYISLNHSNILSARQFFFWNQQKYLVIVLEHCPDGDLSKFIQQNYKDNDYKQRLPSIMEQLAEGLVYIHDKKIVHRDIKPQNILMKNGVPKIGDFGISKIIQISKALTNIGTDSYKAPEVQGRDSYDGRADVWSLGLVFLELFLGQKIRKILSYKTPNQTEGFPSQQLLDRIEQIRMRQLVRKMLRSNPKDRLNSRQVLNWLKGYYEDQVERILSPRQNQVNTVRSQNQISVKQKRRQQQDALLNIENPIYAFSQQHKSKFIQLNSKNFKAKGLHSQLKYALVLIDGPVRKKDSSIVFKIQNLDGGAVAVGLAIKSVVALNSYKIEKVFQIGHGCYLMSDEKTTYSHTSKRDNWMRQGFDYFKKDFIQVETNENELVFSKLGEKKKFRMSIQLTEAEWAQARFCVLLHGSPQLSVSISDGNSSVCQLY